MSEEQRKYISESLTGHFVSEETKKKISNSNKGVSRNKGNCQK